MARQVVLWRAMRGSLDAGLSADLREQIVQGLRLSGASADPRAVLSALTSAEPLRAGDLDTPTAVGVAHLASAVKNNTLLLRRAPSLAGLPLLRKPAPRPHRRDARRDAITPHRGQPLRAVRRAVRAADLSPDIAVSSLTSPGRPSVLLGDPGAGKSTLAGKLTHDLAQRPDERVPFLLVLRDFTASFRSGGRELLRYYEHICSDPYNLTPPRDAVEYLLRNGRAVLLLRLPYLEARVDFDAHPPFEMDPRLTELDDSREMHLLEWGWDPPTGMSEAVIDLLTIWTTRDFNVIE